MSALGLTTDDTVLEVGPGKGILTERLVERAGRVIAVELDERLVRLLSQRFGERCTVVHQDILEFPLCFSTPVKVMGNLPYNISSQVLFRLLEHTGSWTNAVLTCQREFAARVLALPGNKDYGAVSVFTELECERERLFNIPAWQFKPRPDIVSTAFRLVRRAAPLFRVDDSEGFRSFVKSGFRQRRKTLANNLVAAGLSRSGSGQALVECGLDPRVRAESLSVFQFRELFEAVRRARARQ